jgi:hypothetical protein
MAPDAFLAHRRSTTVATLDRSPEGTVPDTPPPAHPARTGVGGPPGTP